MTSRRLYWLFVIACCLVLVGLLGGTYTINKMLQSRADTLKSERQQIALLNEQESGLKSAKADIQKYQQLAATAKSIVPQDKDQAQTVGEIVKLANENGVQLGSFSFPASTLGTTTTDTSTATTSSSTSGTASASTLTHNASQSQLTPVPGIPGVQSLQIIVSSDTQSSAPYSSFLHFLEALEQNRRTALVTSVTITPDPKVTNNISFTLTLEEYIKS